MQIFFFDCKFTVWNWFITYLIRYSKILSILRQSKFDSLFTSHQLTSCKSILNKCCIWRNTVISSITTYAIKSYITFSFVHFLVLWSHRAPASANFPPTFLHSQMCFLSKVLTHRSTISRWDCHPLLNWNNYTYILFIISPGLIPYFVVSLERLCKLH